MKLLDACHWLLQRRRWLILPGALLIAGLLGLILPVRAFVILVCPVVFATCMMAIYWMAQRHFCTPAHLRMPAPRDARAEVVLVDASLIDGSKRVMAAAQPVNAMPGMSLRMGSGAILLGSAMALLSHKLPEDDAAAMLMAAADLKLQPEALRRKSPTLDEGVEDGMHRITVQDGQEERSYFMASAATVAAACATIWEGQIRPMRSSDRARILDAESYMMAGKCRVYAFATASGTEKPVFLGLAGLGSQLNMEAIRGLNELRSQGLTIALRDDGLGDADMAALRRNLGVPDVHARPDMCLSAGAPCHEAGCLTILMAEGQPLEEPVEAIKTHFTALTRYMTGIGSLLALCLAACMLAGGAAAPLWTALLLAIACVTFGRGRAPQLKRWTLAIPLVICLLSRLLLISAAPQSANAAGNCLCIALTASAAFTLLPHKWRWTEVLPLVLAALAASAYPLITQPLTALFALLTGALAGITLLALNRRFFGKCS